MEKKKKPDGKAVETLLSELRYLRSTVKESGEAFILRTEGRIETVSGYLSGMTAMESRHCCTAWLKALRSTTFKPAKGRIKDLKKIDALLEDLSRCIIETQSIAEKSVRKRKPAHTKSAPAIKVDAT
jgi:hypothetical protein